MTLIPLDYRWAVCLVETEGPAGIWDPAETWHQPHVGACSVETLVAVVLFLVVVSVADLQLVFDSAVEIYRQNVVDS